MNTSSKITARLTTKGKHWRFHKGKNKQTNKNNQIKPLPLDKVILAWEIEKGESVEWRLLMTEAGAVVVIVEVGNRSGPVVMELLLARRPRKGTGQGGASLSLSPGR